MKPIFYVLISLVFLSCTKKSTITDFYIGSYRASDQLIPYPYFLKIKDTKATLIDHKGNTIGEEELHKNMQSKDTLKFNNIMYYVAHKSQEKIEVFDLLDTINFKPYENGVQSPKMAAIFNRLHRHHTISLKETKDQLLHKSWVYTYEQDLNSTPNHDLKITTLLSFKKDSLYKVINYRYQDQIIISEYESKAYDIIHLEGMNFISFRNGTKNPQPIYQISEIKNNQVILTDFSSLISKSIQLNLITNQDFKDSLNMSYKYSNCFDGYQGEYYFGDDVTHKKGNKYIVNKIKNGIPAASGNGYVIVHFNVNCKGQIGRFGLLQMNQNFKETKFATSFIKHIIQKVAELKDWPSTESTYDWLYYKDTHAFLMFKIKDGKIIDLCP